MTTIFNCPAPHQNIYEHSLRRKGEIDQIVEILVQNDKLIKMLKFEVKQGAINQNVEI